MKARDLLMIIDSLPIDFKLLDYSSEVNNIRITDGGKLHIYAMHNEEQKPLSVIKDIYTVLDAFPDMEICGYDDSPYKKIEISFDERSVKLK